MKKIHIENINDFILVDDDDFERVDFYKWHKLFTHETQRFLAQIVGRKYHYHLSYLMMKMRIKNKKIMILENQICLQTNINLGIENHKRIVVHVVMSFRNEFLSCRQINETKSQKIYNKNEYNFEISEVV